MAIEGTVRAVGGCFIVEVKRTETAPYPSLLGYKMLKKEALLEKQGRQASKGWIIRIRSFWQKMNPMRTKAVSP